MSKRDSEYEFMQIIDDSDKEELDDKSVNKTETIKKKPKKVVSILKKSYNNFMNFL